MKEEGCFTLLVVIICILAFVVGIVSTGIQQSTTDDWWRDELVRRGYAHYYLDANNQRQWNWKDQPQ